MKVLHDLREARLSSEEMVIASETDIAAMRYNYEEQAQYVLHLESQLEKIVDMAKLCECHICTKKRRAFISEDGWEKYCERLTDDAMTIVGEPVRGAAIVEEIVVSIPGEEQC